MYISVRKKKDEGKVKFLSLSLFPCVNPILPDSIIFADLAYLRIVLINNRDAVPVLQDVRRAVRREGQANRMNQFFFSPTALHSSASYVVDSIDPKPKIRSVQMRNVFPEEHSFSS